MAVAVKTKTWDSEWRVGDTLGPMALEREMFKIYKL